MRKTRAPQSVKVVPFDKLLRVPDIITIQAVCFSTRAYEQQIDVVSTDLSTALEVFR